MSHDTPKYEPASLFFISTNGGDDRVRAGDSTQVRAIDRALRVHRFVLKLFIRFGIDRRPIHVRLCNAILRVLVPRCKHRNRSKAVNVNSVHRTVRIGSVVPCFINPCRHLDNLRLALPSSACRISNLRTTALTDGREVISTQVRTA
jgi:hypothetical protein